jgi:hypothetical protein
MTTTKDVTIEKDAKAIDKELVPLMKEAIGVTIKNPDNMKSATEVLSRLNQISDKVKKSKESRTKPLNETLKWVRSLFAPMEERLDSAIESIRSEMSRYQTEQKRIADAEAAKIALRIGEGKGKLSVETAIKKMENIEKPEQKVEADSGSVKFVTVKKFSIENISKIPYEFLLPNEVMIRKAMLEGKELPGVKYWEEQSVRNSR